MHIFEYIWHWTYFPFLLYGALWIAFVAAFIWCILTLKEIKRMLRDMQSK